jgi:hypothetical protein
MMQIDIDVLRNMLGESALQLMFANCEIKRLREELQKRDAPDAPQLATDQPEDVVDLKQRRN